jgi:hypothetical protein
MKLSNSENVVLGIAKFASVFIGAGVIRLNLHYAWLINGVVCWATA